MIRFAMLGLLLFPSPGFAQTSPNSSPPDVFLITIDTLRADHVACYGYKDVETPAIDSLAADGIRFTHAYTHSPITNTSHTTILTGLLPSVHGVTDFGVPLAPQHVTWAELLQKQHYQTAAFIGAVILDSNQLAPGLDRGFDFYDNFPVKTESSAKAETTAKAEIKPRWGRVERRAMDVINRAELWLDKHPRAPANSGTSKEAARKGAANSDAAHAEVPRFLWIHMYDPHDPYEPPPPFSDKYARHLYDGEIAYADSALAHFIATLKKSGAYDNAIIIVVGDHGEGLGEHGEETHGLFLYDSTLHVPLIVKLASAAHHGMVVDSLVRTTDILPTVLALTKMTPPAELNGESLVPYFESASQPPRSLFGETDYPLRWGWSPLRALRQQNAKLIDAPRPEFYDLQSDPQELKNLYSPHRTEVVSLQSEMTKWKAKLPEPANGAQATANLPSATLPDPKDKVEVQNLLVRAMLASDEGRTSEARQSLEKAVQLDPDSSTASRQLGEIELAAEDYAKAATHLKRAVQLRPDDSTAAFEAGQALEKTLDYPSARDALEASLKQAPSQVRARVLLGHVYLELKDARNAEDQFEAALLVDSDNGEAKLGLAEAQIMKGDFKAALPDLEALTKSDPRNAAAWRLLAQAYRGLHREGDAVKADHQAATLDGK